MSPFLLPIVHEAADRIVVWDVLVGMSPESARTMLFGFGDGDSESFPIPRGAGLHSVKVEHEFPENTSGLAVNEGGYVVQNVTVEGMHPAQGYTRFGPARPLEIAIPHELESRLKGEGIALQRGLGDYMQQNGGACHLVLKGAADQKAAWVALELFGADLSLIPHPDEPSEGLPNFVSAVTSGDEGPQLWFDVKDNFDVFPELVGRVVELLADRLLKAAVKPATIGWPDLEGGG